MLNNAQIKINFSSLIIKVTTINPQQVFTAIGDTLTGLGDAIQNSQPAALTSATDSIRQGYNEFRSLIFRR